MDRRVPLAPRENPARVELPGTQVPPRFLANQGNPGSQVTRGRRVNKEFRVSKACRAYKVLMAKLARWA